MTKENNLEEAINSLKMYELVCMFCKETINKSEDFLIESHPHIFIEQLIKNVNEEVADLVLENDGTLVTHRDCYEESEVKRVFDEAQNISEEEFDFDEEDRVENIRCSSCNLVYIEEKDRCPRCGAKNENDE